MIAALLAAAELCGGVKTVLRDAPKDFATVRGKATTQGAGKTRYEHAFKLEDATGCVVVTYEDGSTPFYFCKMHATTCRLTEKKYEAYVSELACLGKPGETQDKPPSRRQTRFMIDQRLRVRVLFEKPATEKDCALTVFVEK